MGAAFAQVRREGLPDHFFRQALGRREERRSLHDHAIDAVPALDRLLIDERLLHRMRLFGGAEPLKRDPAEIGITHERNASPK